MIRLAVVATLVVSACAQSAMTVEVYAARIEAAGDSYIEEAQSLSAAYQSSVEDQVRAVVAEQDPAAAQDRVVEIATAATANYLALLSDAMARFIAEMEELRPPADVAAAHDEFVSAVGSVQRSLPATRDAVVQADSLASIRLALTTSGFADGQLRWTAACSALEETLRGRGTGVDLGCVRQEVAP